MSTPTRRPFTDAELAERRRPFSVEEEAAYFERLPGRMLAMGYSEQTATSLTATVKDIAARARQSGHPHSLAVLEQGCRLLVGQRATLARINAAQD